MKVSTSLKWMIVLGVFLGYSEPLLAQNLATESGPKKTPSSQNGKVQGYMGDPALKRGVELGYDIGVKAGKADKAQNKKADPTHHPDYLEADKKHRSEYGSRASFVRGYQMGFTKGYTVSYTGKAAPLKAPSVGAGTATIPEATPSKPKQYDPSEDAL